MSFRGASLSDAIKAPSSPFPGLRPFEFHESDLFFGRDGQVEKLIGKLGGTRFTAVVGTSGSGKSSLVRAGLVPALVGGLMTSAGSDWRIAIMRPGNDPIGSLALSLNQPNVFGSDDPDSVAIQVEIAKATLRRGSRGLVETVCQNVMASDENLLVVVDQFEELFRFAREASRKTKDESDRYRNEAAAFVKLLLDASAEPGVNIYVVITMRSDFLGDCAQFWNLPEAINESQYLIPRLTRDQLREVISGPVALADGEIAPRLVTQLLNDIGDNQDELPVLQHLMMRIWNESKNPQLNIDVETGEKTVVTPHREIHHGKAIDICCYQAVGGMSNALSHHADEAYSELPDDRHREVAEKLFKALTEKGFDNREIRRPITLGEICEITEASESEVKTVVETFRQTGRSFLMPPVGVPLTSDSLIDISHESLIRGWARLREWVDEEARSARIYRRLAETAVLYQTGDAGLWRDPDLQIALEWREKGNPNEIWARRYHPEFRLAEKFLDTSVEVRDQQLEFEKTRQRSEIKRVRITALVMFAAFLVSLGLGGYALAQKRVADKAKDDAVAQRELADNAKEEAFAGRQFAEQAARDALKQKKVADKAKDDAFKQKELADQAKDDALKQQKLADAAKNDALEQKKKADKAKNDALTQQGIAEEQAKVAQAEALKGKALSALREDKPDEAKTYFSSLNELSTRMSDPSGQAYALAGIGDIHKERIPLILVDEPFTTSVDWSEAENSDVEIYVRQLRLYAQMSRISDLEGSGKTEKEAYDDLSKAADEAGAFYVQALETNKLNRKPDKAMRDGRALESLADLALFKTWLRLQFDDTDKKRPDAQTALELEQAIKLFTDASEAFRKAKMPLAEGDVLRKKANLLWNFVDKPVAGTVDAQSQQAPPPERTDNYANGQARVIDVYLKAQTAYHQAERTGDEISILDRVGKVYWSLPNDDPDRIQKAIEYVTKARDLAGTAKLYRREAALNVDLALLYKGVSDNQEIESYKKAYYAYRKAATQSKSSSFELAPKAIEMLRKAGDLLYESGKTEETKSFFEEVVRGSGDDPIEKATTLSTIGDFYKDKDFAESLRYYELKRQAWKNAGKPQEEGNASFEIGLMQYDKRNIAAAIEAFDSTLSAYQRIAEDKESALSRHQNLMRMAPIYAEQDKKKAIAIYEEALRLSQVTNITYQTSEAVTAEGRLLLELKTDEGRTQAAQLFQRVLDQYQTRTDSEGQGSILISIGDLYVSFKQNDDARVYYDRALALGLAAKKDRRLNDLLRKIGDLETAKQPGKSSLDYFLEVAKSAGESGNPLLKGIALQSAGFYADSTARDKPKAIEYYEQAIAVFHEAGMKAEEADTLRSMSYVYEAMSNGAKATELRKKADELTRPLN
jgi:energy-coupling factor transporter ATP-binding protein EcfA2